MVLDRWKAVIWFVTFPRRRKRDTLAWRALLGNWMTQDCTHSTLLEHLWVTPYFYAFVSEMGCNMPAALFWPDCYSLALTLHSTVHSLLLFCPRWRVCVKKSSQERLALKILIDRPKARNEVRQSFPVLCCTWINLACVSAAHTCFFCLWGCHILQHSIWGAPLVGSSLFVFQACSQHASTPDTAGKICTEHLSWIMSFCFWSKYSVSSNSDPGAKIGTPRCCFCSPFHFG